MSNTFYTWGIVFTNEPSQICGQQPLKNWSHMYIKTDHNILNFLTTAFHIFDLVHSWIFCPTYLQWRWQCLNIGMEMPACNEIIPSKVQWKTNIKNTKNILAPALLPLDRYLLELTLLHTKFVIDFFLCPIVDRQRINSSIQPLVDFLRPVLVSKQPRSMQ